MKFKGFKSFNAGDWLLFSTIGLFLCSLVMGLSIRDYSFAKEIIVYLVPMGLLSYGFSLILNGREFAKQGKDE